MNEPRPHLRISPSSASAILRFGAKFAGLALLFSTAVQLDANAFNGAAVGRLCSIATIAVVSTLELLGEHPHIEVDQIRLGSSQFEIVADCTGIEVIGLFIAAIIAFPTKWRSRLRAMAVGLPVLLIVNWVRLVSLVLIGTRSDAAFEYGHLYAWPAVVLVIALGIWAQWASEVLDRGHSTL